MTPGPGERLLRFVGDRARVELRAEKPLDAGWRAFLRTNLGRARRIRSEILGAHFAEVPLAGASWRDIPMRPEGDGVWALDVPLAEVGYFKSKPYLADPNGWQHWPHGPDIGVTVHPDSYRTANTIYCAFVRMFGPSKTATTTTDEKLEAQIKRLDTQGYSVIPPSGKLRDLKRELPHIIDTLGCRVVHLLPVNPTPTTYARFGRFGSPYAIQDLTAIDPALVEFEKRTTGVQQFCELAAEVHARGARLFLDVVINHTGWGSTVQENHPEWFLRKADGEFESPGAWGNTWADLVELEHKHPALWEEIAQAFRVWCRRGVDGFRCDAGYKVPVNAWQYIIASVREEFPDALFLLEGLGGGWWDTETLLTEGGMQWAYSELFQEFNGEQVARYLDHALKQSARAGLLVHYSETHDNLRLADKGKAWSLHRNRLCALTSVSGGFGFTCGVEWLAPERVNVHSSRGLAWGSKDNIVEELARLNRLLVDHPCFFDNATLTRLSPPGSAVYALRRESLEGADRVLVLANTDQDAGQSVTLKAARLPFDSKAKPCELLGQPLPAHKVSGGEVTFTLPPGACVCLADSGTPRGLAGEAYRTARAQAAWAMTALSHCVPMEDTGQADWRELAAMVSKDPAAFLGACTRVDSSRTHAGLPDALGEAIRSNRYAPVVRWRPEDSRRVTLIPPGHWLLIEDDSRFAAGLLAPGSADGPLTGRAEAIPVERGWVAFLPPGVVEKPGRMRLRVERFSTSEQFLDASVEFLGGKPAGVAPALPKGQGLDAPFVLLTNGIGGMARMALDFGSVKSKYDCVLAANLHSSVPVDRHVFVKRVRIWCNADGFITALNRENLDEFYPGPPAAWSFMANAGDGRAVPIEVMAEMPHGENTTVLHFRRMASPPRDRRVLLPGQCDVRLTIRVDIEDRNFHWETKHNGGSDHHFHSHTRTLAEVAGGRPAGFAFTPAADRQLQVVASRGRYHPAPEWSHNIPHLVEQTRGQEGAGDAFSPGWFEVPLGQGEEVTLVLTAEPDPLTAPSHFASRGPAQSETKFVGKDRFGDALRQACKAYVVRRGDGKTVIAGYPWFLDWGRDSLIAARGLLAAGMVEDVRDLLRVFGKFEKDGTLPNTIHGENASNRDTSDAPLWYGIVFDDLATLKPDTRILEVEGGGRTVTDVLRSIAVHYKRGTPNGIRMDEASGLVWSPAHFTWMDTNFPAGTPREGYPVEIQVMWIRLLRMLDQWAVEPDGEPWAELADRALKHFETFFWLEEPGYYADVLIAKSGEPARTALPDQALRSNMLFAVSLELIGGERARRCVEAARRHLVVPGALRSLAPLPVSPPLTIRSNDGRVLNDPMNPYWGRYEGDEDTRRKPAYHNGTAWGWTFPTFCEAVARAWQLSPEAIAAAKAYLGSVDALLQQGCIGQLPEVVDGDAPHQQRGCDAQAWSVTEALRVWKLLNEIGL